MRDKKDTVRLKHMLDAAREALAFAREKSRPTLNTDRMLLLALVKSIEIVGEAASGLSEICRNQYPAIPWRNIINMRHRLIHAYFDINPDVVWNTVAEDLPPLMAELEKILQQDEA
ncbi:MAG: hypothetical protein COV67_01880 [Nitrospinae bacterium CG11_big_fil_rev_8_21_14_0_20_56_8]|nr:MAG: hypothetical protein COV67_01880 [Nitrospinae bacterium CG11_big_fil_rev_8_21_14_0_20_56_8]